MDPFVAGCREALGEVYRAYRSPVDAYLNSLVSSKCWRAANFAVADLRQEVFLHAFAPRARAAYDPARLYAPYLMRIARNCFIDESRLRRRELLLPASEALDGELDWADTRESWDPRFAATVQSYLGDLPPRLRAVYDQRFVCGQSQEIACSALGLTRRKLRTAEEHLKRGLRKALVLRGCSPP